MRAHWRGEVDRRSRGRRVRAFAVLATAATVIVAVALGLWQFLGVAPGDEIAGRVEVVTAPAAMRVGDEIAAGSELVTGPAERIALRLDSGHSVRVDAQTRLRVLSDHEIALDRGAVYVDSRGPSGLSVGTMEIRTPFGRLRDIGTQFEARLLGAGLRVRVREGAIALDGRDSAQQVEAGQELEIDGDGREIRREISAFGEEWEWIAAITPMMELEGRRLTEFLKWMAREQGLRLRFAGPDIARVASEITLDGSIAGMTLDQALDSVLITSRMGHRVDRTDLVVESLGETTEAP